MKRSKELLAGLSLTASLALGVTACGSAAPKAENKPAQVTKYSDQMRSLAARLISLVDKSSSHYTAEPYYSEGFSVPTTGGGLIYAQVQSPNSGINASRTTSMSFEQLFPNKLSFGLYFDVNADGTWNTICQANSSSVIDSMAETGENTVQVNGKTKYTESDLADAFLSDDIQRAESVLNSISGEVGQMPVPQIPNICRTNFG